MMLSRAQWAGVCAMIVALVMIVAAVIDISVHMHITVEALCAGILAICGMLLALARDQRCQPKVDRLNNILLRALAKDLHVEDEHDGSR
jgi:hypothetical protein